MIPTPHIEAKKSDISNIVIMAGDPLRAKSFVVNKLVDYKLVSEVRNMFIYTGFTENGTKITVMGHGMGLSSIGIYAYELYKFYDVDYIIRFGSAGSYFEDIKIYDLVLAKSAYSSSNFGDAYDFKGKNIIDSDDFLYKQAKKSLQDLKLDYHDGTVNSSQWFYSEIKIDKIEEMQKKNILVVEMEAYALYAIAKSLNKKALTILTCSDNLITNEAIESSKREKNFLKMFNLLENLVDKLNGK